MDRCCELGRPSVKTVNNNDDDNIGINDAFLLRLFPENAHKAPSIMYMYKRRYTKHTHTHTHTHTLTCTHTLSHSPSPPGKWEAYVNTQGNESPAFITQLLICGWVCGMTACDNTTGTTGENAQGKGELAF